MTTISEQNPRALYLFVQQHGGPSFGDHLNENIYVWSYAFSVEGTKSLAKAIIDNKQEVLQKFAVPEKYKSFDSDLGGYLNTLGGENDDFYDSNGNVAVPAFRTINISQNYQVTSQTNRIIGEKIGRPYGVPTLFFNQDMDVWDAKDANGYNLLEDEAIIKELNANYKEISSRPKAKIQDEFDGFNEDFLSDARTIQDFVATNKLGWVRPYQKPENK